MNLLPSPRVHFIKCESSFNLVLEADRFHFLLWRPSGIADGYSSQSAIKNALSEYRKETKSGRYQITAFTSKLLASAVGLQHLASNLKSYSRILKCPSKVSKFSTAIQPDDEDSFLSTFFLMAHFCMAHFFNGNFFSHFFNVIFAIQFLLT